MLVYISGTILLLASYTQCINIGAKMIEAEIVPKFCPYPPKHLLKVIYPHGELYPGQMLTYKEAENKPVLRWDSRSDKFYCLFYTGISKWSWGQDHEWASWVVFDIPGDNIDKGTEIYPYYAPLGVKNVTGKSVDRYAFFIYEQHHWLGLERMKDYKKRQFKFITMWTMTEFVEAYEMGQPIWGNYFLYQR